MARTNRIPLLILASATLAIAGSIHAEVFTVATPAEFQEALDVAAENGEHDTIHVEAGSYNLLTLPNGALVYSPAWFENFSLAIEGDGADSTTIHDGMPNLHIDTSDIFDSQANIAISGIAFNYGIHWAPETGGGGLHVHTTSAEITVEDCEFGNNSSLVGGGAYLHSEVGLITLTNSFFYDNAAGDAGGGLWARSDNGLITITDSTFLFNYSAIHGGAAFASSHFGAVRVIGNNFQDNLAEWDAGGAYAKSWSGTVVVEANTFTSNDTSFLEGGGAYLSCLSDGTLSLANNVFDDNSANAGGGAYAEGGTIAVARNTFTRNSAHHDPYSSWGGGLFATSTADPITLTSNTFDDNTAALGGGGAAVSSESGGLITLNRNTFADNSAGGTGGGAYASAGTWGAIVLTNNVFASNSVEGMREFQLCHGGGATVWAEVGKASLVNNTCVNNRALEPNESAGGGIWLYVTASAEGGKADIYNNIIWGNTAASGGDLYINDGEEDPGGPPVFTPLVNVFNNDLSDFGILWGDNLLEGDNIDEDPLLSPFFHLPGGSPCIDTGVNSAPLPPTDFDGEPRIIDGNADGTAVVDIGADEFYPFRLAMPIVIIGNLSHLLDRLSPMSYGTLQKGTMTFWVQEPNDRMPRLWGSRSCDVVVLPRDKMAFPFEWPPNNIEPSNDAIIYWTYQTTIRTARGGARQEYPVYAFSSGTRAPDQPSEPPRLELKGLRGLNGAFLLYAFGSSGSFVGTATVRLGYPVEAATPVRVDIKPGSAPNPINVKSQGVLPVAVLGAQDFDVRTIDPATVRLTREGVVGGVAPIRRAYRDVGGPFVVELGGRCDSNSDGYLDLLLMFKTQALVRALKLCDVAGQTLPLIVTGRLLEEEGSLPVRGQEDARILDWKKEQDRPQVWPRIWPWRRRR